MKQLSFFCALLTTLLMFACGDDDSPVRYTMPDSTNSDTNNPKTEMRITGVDTTNICPEQLINVFGEGFPPSAAELHWKIGDIPVEATTVSETHFSAEAPWLIKHGRIELLDDNDELSTAWTLEISQDCKVEPDKVLDITLEGPFNLCPCDLINLSDEDIFNNRNLRLFIGNHETKPSFNKAFGPPAISLPLSA